MNNHAPARSPGASVAETAKAELQPAPEPTGPNPEAKPLNYRMEVLLESKEGYHFAMTGEGLTPQDALVWMENISAGLAKRGFKPVRRDLQVNVTTTTAPPAGAPPAGVGGSGDATAIPPDGAKPPRCSLHGPMRWVEGVFKEGNPRAGQRFEFWGCSERSCKVTYRPTP